MSTGVTNDRGALRGSAVGPGERRLVSGLIIALAIACVWLSTAGPIGMVAALVLTGFVTALALLGRERMATLLMMAVFATAPMYKGLAPSEASSITPTDLLLAASAVLLLPTLLTRPVRLPVGYVAGVGVILFTGLLSTAFADNGLLSLFQFFQWLVVLVGLIVIIAVWRPSWRVVDLLLWSYVVGQGASFLSTLTESPPDGRYLGLSHHPNAFGEAGLMAFAALMYLWTRSTTWWYRAAVLAAAAMSVQSVMLSGSRAAVVVIAGLILMVPFVERSALRGFLLAAAGALFVVAYPLLVGSTGESSALSRLSGTVDAVGADQARLEAQQRGIDLFFASPIIGSGFADAIYVHNVLLAVLSSVGVVGVVGYLSVLFTLARPIIGRHPNRRLAYLVWAFVAITPTVPALEDRTLWIPMAPAILLALGRGKESSDEVDVGDDVLEPTTESPSTDVTPRTAR